MRVFFNKKSPFKVLQHGRMKALQRNLGYLSMKETCLYWNSHGIWVEGAQAWLWVLA